MQQRHVVLRAKGGDGHFRATRHAPDVAEHPAGSSPERPNRSERMGRASNTCKIESGVLRISSEAQWLRVEVCPMSLGWAQTLGSAHVTRVVIATAGVATLVVGRAGVAMAAGPPIGASATTPAGKAAGAPTNGQNRRGAGG